MRYRVKDLENRPTLCVGQTDNLKLDTGTRRVWLARTGVDDGEPFDNRITEEELVNGRWKEVDSYAGEG